MAEAQHTRSSTSRARHGVPMVPGQIPPVNHVFRDFGGINTQAARQAIGDKEFSWIENVMPIGFGNAKVVPAISDILATYLGETIYYHKAYNIGGVSFLFLAAESGAAYQLNLTTLASTAIAPAATFPSSGTQIAQWKNERILIINQNNYYDWDGATLTVLGGTTSAPTAGQCIATYAGRVWISQGRTINYSQPASYTNFSGTSGGNTVISDDTLTSDITQLLSANNFLYFFGDDSINVIADVQVVSGATQFSNTNISANSGTNLAHAIIPYFRSIWYMNMSGIYALYGATPRKASDNLDGLFEDIDFTLPVTAGTVILNNILCAAFMFTYNDPVQGMARKIMAIYFNKKWFIASQGTGLTIMASAQGDGEDTLYAVDTERVYQLFEDTESDISSKMETVLWDFGNMVNWKEALKLGIECNLEPGVGTVSPTVDSEQSKQAPEAGFNAQFAFEWLNSNGDTFTWTNSLAQVFTWLASGYVWFQGNVEQGGHYLGITAESVTPQIRYSGLQLQYRVMPGNWGETA